MNASSSYAPPALARYRPLFKLGQGGMADVYVAISRAAPGLERLVVIKRLRTDLLVGDQDDQDPSLFVAMFRDEARLSVLLKHANVVHTYDVFEEDGALYLVMELIEGQPLNTVARELHRRGAPLAPAHAALIAAEVLAGLQYAHEITDLAGERLDIVHRDVSPQNILVGFDGVVKLLDFGVAKASFRSAHTRAGTMKGKARYMAPEQVVNRSVDRRADLYSVGVILWELVAGKKLVSGATEVEQLMNVLQGSAPPLSSVVPDVHPVLDAIVARALSREADDRFATAAEMREALLAYIAIAGPARSDEIGRIVTELFPVQREAIKTTIRARLALPETGPADMGEALRVLDADEARHSRGLVSASRPTRSPISSGSFAPAPISGTPRPMPIAIAAGSSSYPPSSAAPLPPAPVAVEAAPTIRKRLLVPIALLVLAVGVAGGFAIVGASNASRVAVSAPAPLPAASSVAPTASVAPAVFAEAPSSEPTPPAASAPAIEPAPSASAVVAGMTGASRGAVRPWHAPVGAAPAMKAAPHDEPAPAAAVEAAPGYLTLETFPWTKVSVDGKSIGATPIVHVSLPAGTHTVTMENAGEGVRESTVVTLKSGETLSKRLAFGNP